MHVCGPKPMLWSLQESTGVNWWPIYIYQQSYSMYTMCECESYFNLNIDNAGVQILCRDLHVYRNILHCCDVVFTCKVGMKLGLAQAALCCTCPWCQHQEGTPSERWPPSQEPRVSSAPPWPHPPPSSSGDLLPLHHNLHVDGKNLSSTHCQITSQ